MSRVFDAYAAYYDLLYRDKDYAGEVGYIHSLLHGHVPDTRHVLELGYGTGAHAEALVKCGYRVTGVDISERMIEQARRRAAGNPTESKPDFNVGDLRDYRDIKRYDAVLALFHVMSYQTNDKDLRQAFETAATHLLQNGLFVFDYWHGPGVLSDPPSVRSRVMSDEHTRVTRTSTPTMYADSNIVDVEFDILVENDGQPMHFSETHRMRYLFQPEIHRYLEQAGLQHLRTYAWMASEPAGPQTWYACTVARKL